MSAGHPALSVQLDDGTGAFPFELANPNGDRQSFTKMGTGLSLSTGRSDELSATQPGAIGLTFENINGEFSPGSPVNILTGDSYNFDGGTVGSWVASGTVLPTVANDNSRSWSGTRSMKITWAGSGSFPQAQLQFSGATIGQTYTFSCWLYVPTGSPDVRIGGGSITTALNSTKDTWFPLAVTFTAASTTPTVFVRSSGTPAASVMWVDSAYVNVGALAGSPFQVTPDRLVRIRDFIPSTQAACNLVSGNPSFETTTGAWVQNAGATLTSDTAQFVYGTHALKVVATVENWGYFPMDGGTSGPDTRPNHTVGATYSASIWVYSSTAQPLALIDYGTGATTGPTVNVTANTWTRLTLTFVAGTNVFLSVRDPARTNVVGTIWLDGWMINTGSTPYEFTPNTVPTATTRWQGRVQGWPVTWPTGDDDYATVTVSGTDVLAPLTRRTLQSCFVESIFGVGTPEFYFPLSDAQAASQALDLTGGTAAAAAGPGGAAPTFGNAAIGVEGETTMATANGGKILYRAPTASVTSPTIYAIAAAVRIVTVPGSNLFLNVSRAWAVGINSSGQPFGIANGTTITWGTAINDGLPHHLLCTSVDGSTLTLYVDGVARATGSVGAPVATDNAVYLCTTGASLLNTSVGSVQISHCAAWPTSLGGLTNTQVTKLYGAVSGYTGETPSARITRICGYGGAGTTSIDTAGTTILGASMQNGRNAADMLQETADADLGIYWADAAGGISFTSGYTLAGSVTPAVTLDALWADETATVLNTDMQAVVNYTVGTTPATGNQSIAQNAASQAAHGLYRTDFEWNVSTDAQVQARANWKVALYSNPSTRISGLALDLLSMDPVSQTAALLLKPGAWLRLTNLPVQAPGGTTLDLVVQEVVESIDDSSWVLTLNCTNRVLVSGWVLGDPTYSVLGSTTRLYV